MTWISSVLQAGGALRQGFDERNDKLLTAAQREQGARAEIDSANSDELAQRRYARQFLGRQQAAQAQSGLIGPSADAVARQSAVDSELDALNIRYQGKLRSWALRQGLQSELSAAKNSATRGYMGAASGLLRGYSNYARGY